MSMRWWGVGEAGRGPGWTMAGGFDSLTNLQVFIAHNFRFVHEDYYCTLGSDKLKILRLRSSRVEQKESLQKLELVLKRSPNLELLDVSGSRVYDDKLFRAMIGLKKLVVLDVSNLRVISRNPLDENRIAAVRIFRECLTEMTGLKVLNAYSMNPLYALSCDQYLNIIGENLPSLTQIRGLGAPVLTSIAQFWSRLTTVHLNFHSQNATFAVRDLAAYFRKINFDQNLHEFSFECVRLDFSGEYLRPFTAAKSLRKLAIRSQNSSGDESDGFRNYIFAFLAENLENLTINVPGNNGKIRDHDFIILADMSPKLRSLNLHNLCTNSFDLKSTVSEKMTNLRSVHFCFGQHGVTTKMNPKKVLSCFETCVNLKRLVLCHPLYYQAKLVGGNRYALDFCENVEREVHF
uniref:Uncharacterized protein n=1 Tax=Romanomermis culicivorax TaxID=13658 RepID=A0A915JBZ9_ROMCU